MARALLLTRQGVDNVDYLWLGAYRLRVDVTDPDNTGADPNIFLYNARPPNPYNQEVWADFGGMASAADFAEYPVGAPRTGTTYPLFRLPFIELDLRSTEEARIVWTEMVVHGDNLLRALDRLDEMVVQEEVWIGRRPVQPSSESSSTSRSGFSANTDEERRQRHAYRRK